MSGACEVQVMVRRRGRSVTAVRCRRASKRGRGGRCERGPSWWWVHTRKLWPFVTAQLCLFGRRAVGTCGESFDRATHRGVAVGAGWRDYLQGDAPACDEKMDRAWHAYVTGLTPSCDVSPGAANLDALPPSFGPFVDHEAVPF